MSVSLSDIMEKYRQYNPMIYVDPSASPALVELNSRGFRVEPANNKIDKGITVVRDLMATERLTIEPSIAQPIIAEISAYEMDERLEKPKGNTPDHTLDALRYISVAYQTINQDNLSNVCVF